MLVLRLTPWCVSMAPAPTPARWAAAILLSSSRKCCCLALSATYRSVSVVKLNPGDRRSDELNEEQQEAVRTRERCVRVVAGPGSGKTSVLTHRIAHEITHNGVAPESILGITFTNKAAAELRERLQDLVGASVASKLTVSTFHSFCSRLLRGILPNEKPAGGLSKNFVIYDDADCERVLKDIFVKVAQGNYSTRSTELDKYRLNLPIQAEAVSQPADGKAPIKYRIPPEDLKRGKYLVGLANAFNLQTLVARKRGGDLPDRPRLLTTDAMKLSSIYQEHLRNSNAADFDDLISLTVYSLHRSPVTRKDLAHRWSYVLVDEFQDTDKGQYELIRLLCENNQNLFVVGDVDQAIYGWRGADSRNMQYLLSRDFPSITTLQLRRNYRSSESILNVAATVIANSQSNRRIGPLQALSLLPVKPLGAPVKVCWLDNPDEESQFVVDEIVRAGPGKWEGCAVLYRTHKQSFLLESNLVRAGIPYKILGATALYSHKVVKDLLQYLHFIQNRDDELALGRIINTPSRGIGEVTLRKLKTWAAEQHLSFPEALQKARDDNLSHKELGITPKARVGVFRFCDIISSLWEHSKHSSVASLLGLLIEKIDYLKYAKETSPDEDTLEKRLQYIGQLLENAEAADSKHGRGREALALFLQDVMLISDANSKSSSANAVSLSTLHAAKGMEFKCVFIVGLNKGTLPHDSSDPEEERRLFYVGITRAQEQLYLTHTHGFSRLRSDDDNDYSTRCTEISSLLRELIGHPCVSLHPKNWEHRLKTSH